MSDNGKSLQVIPASEAKSFVVMQSVALSIICFLALTLIMRVLPEEKYDLYEHEIENCTVLRLTYRQPIFGKSRLVGVWCNDPLSSLSHD